MIPTSYLLRLAYDDAWVTDRPASPAPVPPRERGELRPSGSLGALLRSLMPQDAPLRA